MATLDIDRLESAHRLGFITGNISEDLIACMKDSIVTANEILSVVQESKENGMNLEQISHAVGIHINTVAQFTRWLVSKGLIRVELEAENHKGTGSYKNVYVWREFE